MRQGVLRAPDVEVRDVGGIPHVVSRIGQGTSLFDRPGVFGAGSWTYFQIPKGTEIPQGLVITKDEFSKKYQATHYSISPNHTMPKQLYLMLLDHLAANAIAQLKRTKHG